MVIHHLSTILCCEHKNSKVKNWENLKTKTCNLVSTLEKSEKYKILRIKIFYGDQPPFSAGSTKTRQQITEKIGKQKVVSRFHF